MIMEYSPLDENVIEKKHAKPNISPSENPLPEAIYPSQAGKILPPLPFDEDDKKNDKDGVPNNKNIPKKEPSTPLNPSLESHGKESNKAATVMADSLIFGYKKINIVVGQLAKVSDKKFNNFVIKGLNPYLTFDLGRGETTPINMVNEFNEQVEGLFIVEQEFVDELRPPLIRVLKKHGIGATDEQQLIFLVGQDILLKGQAFIRLHSTMNQMLKQLLNISKGLPADYKEPENKGKENTNQQSFKASDKSNGQKVQEPLPTKESMAESNKATDEKPKNDVPSDHEFTSISNGQGEVAIKEEKKEIKKKKLTSYKRKK